MSIVSRTTQGQIFLDAANPILEEQIGKRLKDGHREPCELKVADFDDVMYKVTVEPNALARLTLSVSMTTYNEVIRQGGNEYLEPIYGLYTQPKPESGYHLTLSIDLDNPGGDPEQILKSLTEVKRNVCGALLQRAFWALQQGQAASLSLMTLPWRRNETVYIVPQVDRVTVIFAIDFPEDDERAIARVFLTEFADAQTQRAANNCPPCNFTPDPPLELQGARINPSHRVVGYLSFVIFTQHVESGRQEKTVTLLTGFRNYIHYHIKATKTYMHMRMRKRVASLLQVLNRAIPEDDVEKEKKTAQGRTFTRS